MRGSPLVATWPAAIVFGLSMDYQVLLLSAPTSSRGRPGRRLTARAATLDDVDALPQWEPGTAAVLVTGEAHAIPVSTCVRAGDRRVLLALGRRRRALELLRDAPATAICMLAEGLAFTAWGPAAVVRDPLEAAGTAVAVELRVERIQEHLGDGRTEMLAAPGWRWRDERAAADGSRILAELEELAQAGG